jgi:hypothetical protein
MTDNNQGPGTAGLLLGGVCVIAAAFFLLTGGELGGNKKVHGDADLPPVASPVPPSQN